MDELCGSDVKQLLRKAEDWEGQYLKALPKPGNIRVTKLEQIILLYKLSSLNHSFRLYPNFTSTSFYLLQVKHRTMLQARSL